MTADTGKFFQLGTLERNNSLPLFIIFEDEASQRWISEDQVGLTPNLER